MFLFKIPIPLKAGLTLTDFTAESDSTLSIAYRLASVCQTEVIQWHLLSGPIISTDGAGQIQAIKGQPVDLLVLVAPTFSVVETVWADLQADQLGPYMHWPVLFAKKLPIYLSPKNVLLAVNVDDRRKAIQPYPFPLPEFGIRQFLYVMDSADYRDNQDLMEVCKWVSDFARAQAIHDFSFVIDWSSSVAEGIIGHAASMQADLIVLFDHGSANPSYWANSTVIRHVLTAAQVPVLVMKS